MFLFCNALILQFTHREMQKGEWAKRGTVMMIHHVVISRVWNQAKKIGGCEGDESG